MAGSVFLLTCPARKSFARCQNLVCRISQTRIIEYGMKDLLPAAVLALSPPTLHRS